MKIMRGRDVSSGSLFGESGPGEGGPLAPGYHFNEGGEIIDDKGDVYNGDYTLKRKALDPYFEKALNSVRENLQNEGRNEPEEFVRQLARIEAAQARAEDKRKEKEQKRAERARAREAKQN
jgi:hypothetical protein